MVERITTTTTNNNNDMLHNTTIRLTMANYHCIVCNMTVIFYHSLPITEVILLIRQNDELEVKYPSGKVYFITLAPKNKLAAHSFKALD